VGETPPATPETFPIRVDGAPAQLTWNPPPLEFTLIGGLLKLTIAWCDAEMPPAVFPVMTVEFVCSRSVAFVSARTPRPAVPLTVTPWSTPVLPVATLTPLKLLPLIVLILPGAQVGNGANVHWISTVEPSNSPTPSFGWSDTVVPRRRSFAPVLAVTPRPPFDVIAANWMSALAPSKRLIPLPALPVMLTVGATSNADDPLKTPMPSPALPEIVEPRIRSDPLLLRLMPRPPFPVIEASWSSAEEPAPRPEEEASTSTPASAPTPWRRSTSTSA